MSYALVSVGQNTPNIHGQLFTTQSLTAHAQHIVGIILHSTHFHNKIMNSREGCIICQRWRCKLSSLRVWHTLEYTYESYTHIDQSNTYKIVSWRYVTCKVAVKHWRTLFIQKKRDNLYPSLFTTSQLDHKRNTTMTSFLLSNRQRYFRNKTFISILRQFSNKRQTGSFKL